MKNSFFNRLFFFLLVIFSSLGLVTDSFGQKSEGLKIKGSVVDTEGKIVKGAVILIKGTTSGTVTNMEGNFALTVPSADAVLVVSFIDFETKEVLVGEKTEFQISLKPEAAAKLSEDGFMVHDKVDQMPSPSGGIAAWNQYMSKSVKYPQSAREAKTQGTVVVGFKVNEDGELVDAEVIRGIGGGCDQEAVRVVAEGPNWEPAIKGGQAVTTQLTLPIRFVISTDPGVSSPKQRNEKAIADRFGKHVTVIGYEAN